MGVTPCGVHDECAWIFTNGLCKCLGDMFDDDISPPDSARRGSVEGSSVGILAVGELGDLDLCPETRFALLTLDRASVDGKVSKVCQELLSTVLALNQLEEIRGVVDELEWDVRKSHV